MLAEVDISSDPQRCERLLRTDHVLHQALDLHPLLPHLQPQQDHAVSHLLWYRIQLHLLHHLPLHLLLLLSQHQQKGTDLLARGQGHQRRHQRHQRCERFLHPLDPPGRHLKPPIAQEEEARPFRHLLHRIPVSQPKNMGTFVPPETQFVFFSTKSSRAQRLPLLDHLPPLPHRPRPDPGRRLVRGPRPRHLDGRIQHRHHLLLPPHPSRALPPFNPHVETEL